MPVLEYRPYPSVEPTARGLPPQSVEGATPAAFGAGIGTALEQLGQNLEKVGDVAFKLQGEYDKTAAIEGSNYAQDRLQRRLYGDPDVPGDTGYFGKQGRDAMELRPGVSRDVLTDFAEARGRLANDAQRRLFDLDTRRTLLHAQALISQHASKEFRTYQNDTADARLKLSGGRLAASAVDGDNEAFQRELGDQLLQVRDYGQRNGWSDEQIKAEQEKRTTLAAESWAHGLGARDNPEGAITFLKQNPHLFTADVAKYEGLLGRYQGLADEKVAARAKEETRPGPRGAVATNLIPYTPSGDILSGTGLSADQYQTFRGHLASRESGRYDQPPNAGGYSGRYQMGPTEIKETAQRLGVPVPRQQEFLSNPEMQERFLENYTLDHHNTLMAKSEVYRNASPAQKAAYLAGAHLGGVGGVLEYLNSDGKIDKADSNGTRISSYINSMKGALSGSTSPSARQEPITMVGDSLAAHPIRRGLAEGQESGKVGIYNQGDTAVAGWGPAQILSKVIPNIPDERIKGKVVTLSSGASNDPSQLDFIPEQIKALKDRGASNVVLMGVGTSPKLAGVNDRLAQIAQENGVAFAGPQRKTAGDQIHSTDQVAEMQAVREALAKRGAPEIGPSARGPTDYRAWVDNINRSNLTPAQKEAAIQKVRKEQSDTALGQEQAKSDLILSIQNGTATVEDVERLAAEERISPAARTQAREILRKVEEQKAAQAQAIGRVAAAGNGGPPLDPKLKEDRDALNLYYDSVSPAWAGRPANEVLDNSVNFAVQYGLVPERLQSTIRGGLHSGRPDLAVVAADTVARLRNANPALVGELGDENDLRLATLITAYTSKGMPADEAVRQAQEGLKVDKATREARAEDFDAQRGKDAAKRLASDKAWLTGKLNSWWSADPTLDPVMRQEFEDIARLEYQRTGDMNAARQMALDQINRVWGRTQVGGPQRYAKGAAEKFHGVTGLSQEENARWMNDQLFNDVAGTAALQDPTNPITRDRIRILTDPTQVTRDGRPQYQVWLTQPNGAWQQVVDQRGAPVLWHPDWNVSVEKATREQARVGAVERARTLRRENIEREQAVPDTAR